MLEPGSAGQTEDLPVLLHRELIRPEPLAEFVHIPTDRPDRRRIILAPNEIPVHPQIFRFREIHNPDFAAEVMRRVPQAVSDDIEAMRLVLGETFGLQGDEDGVSVPFFGERSKVLYRHFDYSERDSTPGSRLLFSILGSSVGLSIDPEKMWYFSPDRHPMPEDKLTRYGFDPKKISPVLGVNTSQLPTWSIHNIYDGGLGLSVVFRNIAIVSNNLGLEMIKVDTKPASSTQ